MSLTGKGTTGKPAEVEGGNRKVEAGNGSRGNRPEADRGNRGKLKAQAGGGNWGSWEATGNRGTSQGRARSPNPGLGGQDPARGSGRSRPTLLDNTGVAPVP